MSTSSTKTKYKPCLRLVLRLFAWVLFEAMLAYPFTLLHFFTLIIWVLLVLHLMLFIMSVWNTSGWIATFTYDIHSNEIITLFHIATSCKFRIFSPKLWVVVTKTLVVKLLYPHISLWERVIQQLFLYYSCVYISLFSDRFFIICFFTMGSLVLHT